jgi:hypothetical protein
MARRLANDQANGSGSCNGGPVTVVKHRDFCYFFIPVVFRGLRSASDRIRARKTQNANQEVRGVYDRVRLYKTNDQVPPHKSGPVT